MALDHMKVRVEIEPDRTIVVIFPKKLDAIVLSVDMAAGLAHLLTTAVDEARNEADRVERDQILKEQSQVRLSSSPGKIHLRLGWSDRLRLCWQTAYLLAAYLGATIQEAQSKQAMLDEARLGG